MRFGNAFDLYAQIEPWPHVVLWFAGTAKEHRWQLCASTAAGTFEIAIGVGTVAKAQNMSDTFDGTGVGRLAEDNLIVDGRIDGTPDQVFGFFAVLWFCVIAYDENKKFARGTYTLINMLPSCLLCFRPFVLCKYVALRRIVWIFHLLVQLRLQTRHRRCAIDVTVRRKHFLVNVIFKKLQRPPGR